MKALLWVFLVIQVCFAGSGRFGNGGKGVCLFDENTNNYHFRFLDLVDSQKLERLNNLMVKDKTISPNFQWKLAPEYLEYKFFCEKMIKASLTSQKKDRFENELLMSIKDLESFLLKISKKYSVPGFSGSLEDFSKGIYLWKEGFLMNEELPNEVKKVSTWELKSFSKRVHNHFQISVGYYVYEVKKFNDSYPHLLDKSINLVLEPSFLLLSEKDRLGFLFHELLRSQKDKKENPRFSTEEIETKVKEVFTSFENELLEVGIANE